MEFEARDPKTPSIEEESDIGKREQAIEEFINNSLEDVLADPLNPSKEIDKNFDKIKIIDVDEIYKFTNYDDKFKWKEYAYNLRRRGVVILIMPTCSGGALNPKLLCETIITIGDDKNGKGGKVNNNKDSKVNGENKNAEIEYKDLSEYLHTRQYYEVPQKIICEELIKRLSPNYPWSKDKSEDVIHIGPAHICNASPELYQETPFTFKYVRNCQRIFDPMRNYSRNVDCIAVEIYKRRRCVNCKYYTGLVNCSPPMKLVDEYYNPAPLPNDGDDGNDTKVNENDNEVDEVEIDENDGEVEEYSDDDDEFKEYDDKIKEYDGDEIKEYDGDEIKEYDDEFEVKENNADEIDGREIKENKVDNENKENKENNGADNKEEKVKVIGEEEKVDENKNSEAKNSKENNYNESSNNENNNNESSNNENNEISYEDGISACTRRSEFTSPIAKYSNNSKNDYCPVCHYQIKSYYEFFPPRMPTDYEYPLEGRERRIKLKKIFEESLTAFPISLIDLFISYDLIYDIKIIAQEKMTPYRIGRQLV